MKNRTKFLAVCFSLAFASCMHLKGVAVQDPTGKPARNAVITVGRPDGIAVFDSHAVNDRGEFDFMISTIDLNNIYYYDSSADPVMTMQRIDRNQLGEKMKLHLGTLPKKEEPMVAP